jgi:hypothetical protein
MKTIKDVKNPVWVDEKNTVIGCEIDHEVFGWIPFAASPNDPEQHGRDLYAALVAGEHGDIAPYVPPQPNAEAIREVIVQTAASRLEAFAATRNYSSVVSCVSYANSTNVQFQAEALRMIALRDQTWEALYAVLAAVERGDRPLPSGFEDVQGELPALTWSD